MNDTVTHPWDGATWRLAKGQVIGAREHRGGWPVVHRALSEHHDDAATVVLDDFVDATHMYARDRLKQTETGGSPWVGMFHHPAEVGGPLPSDRRNGIRYIWEKPTLQRVLANMRGAVCFSPDVRTRLIQLANDAGLFGRSMNGPGNVHLLKHPMGDECPTLWDPDADHKLWQVGFYLRDTWLVHQLEVPGSHRLTPRTAWYRTRDTQLRRHHGGYPSRAVTEHSRLSDQAYDMMMTSSVVLTWLFGASANNVVLECIARATPLIVNRLPSVVWYLGEKYPLFADEQGDVPRLFADRARVLDAHQYLIEQRKEQWDLPFFINAVKYAVDCAN